MSFPDRSDIDKPQTWSTFKTFILALWDKSALAEGFQITASAAAAAAASSASTTQALRDSFVAVQGSIGYLPPVAYAAGINLTLPAQTVGYLGQAYAPILSALPFTTSGTFETAKFRVIQGVVASDLAAPGASVSLGHIDEWTGAIPTTLQFAVRDRPLTDKYFGLRGNNSFDNSVKILDAFGESSGSGRPLNLGPGTFLIGATTLPNNITMRGAGMRLTTLMTMPGSTSNMLSNVAGANVTIENLRMDGNSANCRYGRVLKFITDAINDGPGLTLRNITFENCPISGEDGQSSVFIAGLNWIIASNIRYVNNKATLWLSTNDSSYHNLYVGNVGVAAGLPSVVIGGGSNKVNAAYFGGNGTATSTGAPQVRFIGASNNSLIGCTNDSANGPNYEFIDNGTIPCEGNHIIGGIISNPSQTATNTHGHVVYRGHSRKNKILGSAIFSDLGKLGFFAVGEAEFAGINETIDTTIGAMGTVVSALIPGNGSFFRGCGGYNPQGVIVVQPTASPMLYVNTDGVREVVYISGGTVSLISKNGIACFTGSNVSIELEPLESLTITYTVAPSIRADRK